MKYTIVIIGFIILALNIGSGLLIDSIGTPTLITSSAVVIITTLLVFISSAIKQKAAFKVAAPFILGFNGLVEYVLSFFVGETVKNDGYFIAILVLFVFQIIILFSTFAVSRINDE